MHISFIGAGNVASNLGQLFAAAGHSIVYSSPEPLGDQLSPEAAAAQGEIVLLALPHSAKQAALATLRPLLAGKVVVDLTNPLNADWSPFSLGENYSAGEETASLLPESRVVKAFNTIFADVMKPDKQVFDGQRLSAFVAGDDAAANALVAELARAAGFEPIVVGGIRQARHLEAIAHLNIAIAQHGGTDAGFRFYQR